MKTNINDENLKLVLSSSLSAQFDKILNLKSSLHFSNFSYSLNPSNNKRKNIFFDIDYNGNKSPGTILLNNISVNETPFSPFVLNFKTSSNKENQIFSDNEAFNLSLLSNVKYSNLSSFLVENFEFLRSFIQTKTYNYKQLLQQEYHCRVLQI